MTQTNNRFFDDIAKLMTDAAGVAQGFGKEVETALRARFESFVADLDLVRREDFEVARDLAVAARVETDRLKAKVEALEARLAKLERGGDAPAETLVAGEPGGPAVG